MFGRGPSLAELRRQNELLEGDRATFKWRSHPIPKFVGGLEEHRSSGSGSNIWQELEEDYEDAMGDDSMEKEVVERYAKRLAHSQRGYHSMDAARKAVQRRIRLYRKREGWD